MDFEQIRRIAITALGADDFLAEQLVLKGGNAIKIAHGLGNRSSLDLDYSIANDFDDPEAVRDRIETVLRRQFEQEDLIAFDVSMQAMPPSPKDPSWGGYRVEFKLIPKDVFDERGHDLSDVRRRALPVSPTQTRSFRVEISKNEYVDERITILIDDYSIFVYPLTLIVAEKLRAICQQMPEYPKVAHKRARARDFYDLWLIIEKARLELDSAFRETLRRVFDAKRVPLGWLHRIAEFRAFHREDWPGVSDTIAEATVGFDSYFDFVINQIQKLEAAGIIDPPAT